jgi:hypothetical protein
MTQQVPLIIKLGGALLETEGTLNLIALSISTTPLNPISR